jgi:hypothetical protein
VQDGGLPPMTPHGVRHSHATAALAAGEPLAVVSERLGHASSSITANLYQHVLPSTDEPTANTAASRSVRLLAPAIGCRQGQAAKPNAPAVLSSAAAARIASETLAPCVAPRTRRRRGLPLR